MCRPAATQPPGATFLKLHVLDQQPGLYALLHPRECTVAWSYRMPLAQMAGSIDPWQCAVPVPCLTHTGSPASVQKILSYSTAALTGFDLQCQPATMDVQVLVPFYI